MTRYRYRTSVLVGPWRATRREAALDAICSNQARADDTGGTLVWLVPGEIETDGETGPRREPEQS